MANKRIRDLSERTTFSSGDYLATDNSSGTRKVDASKILTPISTAQSTADLVTSRVSNSGDAFSSSKGYDVGDLVVAPTDNLIYRCKTAYSTGASWNSRKANFEQISVVKAVDTLNAALNELAERDDHAKVYAESAANKTYAQQLATVGDAFNSITDAAKLMTKIYDTNTKRVYNVTSTNGVFTFTLASTGGNLLIVDTLSTIDNTRKQYNTGSSSDISSTTNSGKLQLLLC